MIPEQGDVEQVVQDFVRRHLIHEPYDGVDPLADLVFDSMSLEQLLAHLEDTYRILLTPEDIARSNLESVPDAARVVVLRATAVAAGDRSW